jgi:hypothetical protein
MSKLPRVIVTVRSFLFSRTNGEFLIFLFFLILSGIFWLLMTLNETYEKEIVIPVRITNIPADVMLTSDEVDTVRVTIRDRGLLLLSYMFGDDLQHIEANFKNYDQTDGNGCITSVELSKLIQRHLSSSGKITNIKPDKVLFYYNTGAFKRVPIRWKGRVIPEQFYFLSDVSYSPDSVTIYASEERLDSVRMVYTEPLNHVNFRDTLVTDCKFQRIEGVKIVPDHVKITFYTDVLTEESISNIPVKGINMPPNKVLRTFPAKTSVHFVTGTKRYRNISTADFRIVADYAEFGKSTSQKCNIYLTTMPKGISNPRLEVSQVDYLIEEKQQ